ncbi:MAG: ASKHA domain-containing protein [Pseudomonadota bacterium]
MGKCVNHPDVETSYKCMKHDYYLCDDCLECKDPGLYCKFRSSCPIHFLSKKNFNDTHPAVPAESNKDVTMACAVRFEPTGIQVMVSPGTTLLQAAEKAGVYVNASCNGKGSCGKCRLILASGNVEGATTALLTRKEQDKGYVLACQSLVTGDVAVRIPEETLEKQLRAEGMGREATDRLKGLVTVIEPVVEKITVQMNPPTLEDSVSDLDRLTRGLTASGCDTTRLSTGLIVMRQLTEAVRKDSWHVTASILHKRCSSEIVNVAPAEPPVESLGLAVDLGTTSIVVYLVDMTTGAVLAAASGHNSQAACGDDVINRIVCAEKDGVEKLQSMALATINNLTVQALKAIGADASRIDNIVVSGNTTMSHLLLGIEPKYIRREPYIPSVTRFPIMKAREIGLKAAPYAGVFIMPGPASYVGGDIVSGVLYTGFCDQDELTLFIDVGTNGEIVLGNREFLMTAACSAGPAFEGGGIRWGMRAEDGAIETITLDPVSLEPAYATVADKPARGICGSGMIDLMSEMLLKGVIDQNGKFKDNPGNPRLIRFRDEPAFVLAFGEPLGLDEDIVFTESDMRSLILSKAAVYAGFTVLLDELGMDFSMVRQMIITGGFGQHLDIEKAIIIGLLPDMDRSRFKYMGNSSIAGAYMALLSGAAREKATALSNAITYLDFSSNRRFMDAFTNAQFLPHTDARLFPTVMQSMARNRPATACAVSV